MRAHLIKLLLGQPLEPDHVEPAAIDQVFREPGAQQWYDEERVAPRDQDLRARPRGAHSLGGGARGVHKGAQLALLVRIELVRRLAPIIGQVARGEIARDVRLGEKSDEFRVVALRFAERFHGGGLVSFVARGVGMFRGGPVPLRRNRPRVRATTPFPLGKQL
ncbi:MAG: hypothetical protein M3463_20565, partial [Verrucomicrobiota bacterium]|nr:hypothetical protein [Verrucomicrobiota bacterium]